MSKVFKALEQGKRDRALANRASREVGTSEAAASLASPAPSSGRPRSPSADQPGSAEPIGIEAHLVSLLEPISFAAEQYRTLRHIVEQAHRGDRLSVFAVSAAAIGDGKTTTAINLAGALAQAPDVRVLLIDTDLRRPSVSSRLTLDGPDRGLVDAILDPALGLADVVRSCPPFNLAVLPAGPRTDAPYELLKSPRLGALLDEARLQYDYIVLDTPPLVPIPDCRIIAKYVDSFLLVVAADKTPAKLFDEAVAVLSTSKVLGIVFNGGDVTENRYYYGYRYGYGYGARGRYTGYPAVGGTEQGSRPWYRGGRTLDRLLGRRVHQPTG